MRNVIVLLPVLFVSMAWIGSVGANDELTKCRQEKSDLLALLTTDPQCREQTDDFNKCVQDCYSCQGSCTSNSNYRIDRPIECTQALADRKLCNVGEAVPCVPAIKATLVELNKSNNSIPVCQSGQSTITCTASMAQESLCAVGTQISNDNPASNWACRVHKQMMCTSKIPNSLGGNCHLACASTGRYGHERSTLESGTHPQAKECPVNVPAIPTNLADRTRDEDDNDDDGNNDDEIGDLAGLMCRQQKRGFNECVQACYSCQGSCTSNSNYRTDHPIECTPALADRKLCNVGEAVPCVPAIAATLVELNKRNNSIPVCQSGQSTITCTDSMAQEPLCAVGTQISSDDPASKWACRVHKQTQCIVHMQNSRSNVSGNCHLACARSGRYGHQLSTLESNTYPEAIGCSDDGGTGTYGGTRAVQ